MALNSNFRTLTADNIEGIVDDRNYLKSSFENGTITGWTEVAVTLTSGLPTGTPTIGATAASSLALSATSVTPLSGSRSLLVDVPSALTAGHGFISDEFTLDRMDLGKVLTVTFDYERVTGTYNFSGTLGSQTWMVYIYDSTLGGANWIQPAGFLGMNQSSGPGRVRATFQSSVTAGQKYRVAVIASQSAAGASSLEFDNFSCSRQTAPIGPVVTDWISYTPTWSSTGTQPAIGNGTLNGKWRRVGDSVQAQIFLTAGTTTSYGTGNYQFSFPSGLSIDSTKVENQTTLGQARMTDNGIANYVGIVIAETSSNRVSVSLQSGAAWGATTPFTFGNTDVASLEFMAPISGWSSNVQLSNDTDTRVVAARVYQTSQQNIPNGTIPETKIVNLSTVVVDTHSAWSSANNEYVIPVSGVYEILGGVAYGPNATGTRVSYISTVKGGVTNLYAAASRIGTNTAAEQTLTQMSYIDTFAAGDKVFLSGFQSSGGVLATGVNLTSTFLQVKRLSGPSVVAASETVAARYFKTATQSFSVETKLTGFTRIFDTHSAWDSSNNWYRFPVSGKYLIQIQTQGAPVSASVQVPAYKINGGSSIYVGTDSMTAGTITRFSASSVVSVNAGDYIEILHYTSAATNIQPNEVNTHFTITRLGN